MKLRFIIFIIRMLYLDSVHMYNSVHPLEADGLNQTVRPSLCYAVQEQLNQYYCCIMYTDIGPHIK